MNECFKCGKNENQVILSDAISKDGLVKVCRKCSFKDEDVLMIKKPSVEKMRESKMNRSVRERISAVSGVNLKTHLKIPEKNIELSKQEDELKNLVENNVVESVSQDGKKKLIHNFHWMLMRSRRSKKISQEQLASHISEPIIAIKLLERGELPGNYENILKKIENHLGIRIFRNDMDDEKRLMRRTVNIEEMKTEKMTISDLKNINSESLELPVENFETQEDIGTNEEITFKKNPRVFEKIPDRKVNVYGENINIGKEKIDKENEPEFVLKKRDFMGKPLDEEVLEKEKKILSDKDIDDILFGRK